MTRDDLTDAVLDDLLRLDAARTPGDLRILDEEDLPLAIEALDAPIAEREFPIAHLTGLRCEADGAAIVAAVNALRPLVEEVRALRAWSAAREAPTRGELINALATAGALRVEAEKAWRLTRPDSENGNAAHRRLLKAISQQDGARERLKAFEAGMVETATKSGDGVPR